MTTERAKRIHQICGMAACISLLTAGILLMIACYSIYSSGDHPFSREAVAAAFAPISLPIYLCIAVVAADLLAGLFLPADTEKVKPEKQLALILQRLHAKTDLSKCSGDLQAQVAALQRSRKVHRIIRNVLTILFSLLFLCYGLNGKNYHQSEINESMIRAMYLLVPCTLIPFGWGVLTAYQAKRSMNAEISLLKSAPKEALRSPDAQAALPDRSKPVQIARWVMLGLGVCVLVFGFFTGGTADVLTKAINICTECVGLG